MPPEDKDAALFPKIDGKWLLIHRPIPARHGVGPGAHIWVSGLMTLSIRGEHRVSSMQDREGWWDANKVGLNTPLETPEGWLILYHGYGRQQREPFIGWDWHF